jgi:hypothetical protein
MADKMEVRIVLEPAGGGRRKLSLYDPRSGRVTPCGVTAGPDHDSINDAVAKVKNQLESKGLAVTVKEM